MILLDGDEQRVKIDAFAGQTIRLPDRATLRSISSLPDYNTSEKEHKLFKRKRNGSRYGSSFWRATLCALVIYVALSLAVGLPLVLLKSKKEHKPPPPLFSFAPALDLSTPLPLPLLHPNTTSDTTCNSWYVVENAASASPLLLATTKYKLSPAGLITIRSNVTYDTDGFSGVNGNLTVDINKDSKEDEVLFDVQLLSSSKQLRERTNVCFADAGGNRGLTIYIPNPLGAEDYLLFDIHVLLPQHPGVDTLISYLPLFSQTFGNLQQKLWFRSITVEGMGKSISCGSLGASQISVKNVLAPIQGHFNVTDSLSLETVRGSLDADILLTQKPSCLGPTFLSLETGYSPINANVTLAFPSSSGTSPPPSFVAKVKTFNGAINLDISHGPNTVPSILKLDVQNTLEESRISVDSKFQGTFNVLTKLAAVTILDRGISTDKASTKMNANARNITYDQLSESKASGWVGWGPRPSPSPRTPEQGSLDIVSSLSPIILDLG